MSTSRGQQADEFRVPAGHEGWQEPYTAGGAGRLDMRKYVGGHELCSGAGQVSLDVQVAYLQQ